MSNFTICILHHILFGWSIKEDEMGSACSMHGRGDKCMQNFSHKNQMAKMTLETCSQMEDNIKTDLKGIVCENVDEFNWIGIRPHGQLL